MEIGIGTAVKGIGIATGTGRGTGQRGLPTENARESGTGIDIGGTTKSVRGGEGKIRIGRGQDQDL
jgi:hypothetical protein